MPSDVRDLLKSMKMDLRQDVQEMLPSLADLVGVDPGFGSDLSEGSQDGRHHLLWSFCRVPDEHIKRWVWTKLKETNLIIEYGGNIKARRTLREERYQDVPKD